MTENLIEAGYDLTKKSKIKRFYESNKIFIISSIIFILILSGSLFYYLDTQKKKKSQLSLNYVQAKIYLEEDNKEEALVLLKKVIYANEPAYSTLSFFLILDQKLITDYTELSVLFDHILKKNKFEKEVRNLLIYKKAVFNSNFSTESALLEEIKPLLNEKSLWKPHALFLLGDYFVSKKEYIKAKEFYSQVLTIKNLHQNLYDQAKNQLIFIDKK